MAGLWAEASDPVTGEVANTYTLIITDANASCACTTACR